MAGGGTGTGALIAMEGDPFRLEGRPFWPLATGRPSPTGAVEAASQCRGIPMPRHPNAATTQCRGIPMPRHPNAATTQCRGIPMPLRKFALNNVVGYNQPELVFWRLYVDG